MLHRYSYSILKCLGYHHYLSYTITSTWCIHQPWVVGNSEKEPPMAEHVSQPWHSYLDYKYVCCTCKVTTIQEMPDQHKHILPHAHSPLTFNTYIYSFYQNKLRSHLVKEDHTLLTPTRHAILWSDANMH